ncbi:hypothetical protein EKK58_08080 [Candidatus Dependentiae bacterium]|nr:MAG: hypothetical protein EKK58_08080 [Candidatus Dependentiae bacterium]
MNYVLFSIDSVHDTHTLAKFLRHFDTQVAMSKTKGNLVQCIGMWKGQLEVSFLCREEDYEAFVLPLGFTKNQECVITISGDKMECFIDDNYIGQMVEFTAKEALNSDGFTYRPDLNKYWMVM